MPSDLPDNLSGLRTAIEQRIPHGRTDNGGRNDRGAWGEVPEAQTEIFKSLSGELQKIVDKHPKISTIGVTGTKPSGHARHRQPLRRNLSR